jgi:hypothetical protein
VKAVDGQENPFFRKESVGSIPTARTKSSLATLRSRMLRVAMTRFGGGDGTSPRRQTYLNCRAGVGPHTISLSLPEKAGQLFPPRRHGREAFSSVRFQADPASYRADRDFIARSFPVFQY